PNAYQIVVLADSAAGGDAATRSSYAAASTVGWNPRRTVLAADIADQPNKRKVLFFYREIPAAQAAVIAGHHIRVGVRISGEHISSVGNMGAGSACRIRCRRRPQRIRSLVLSGQVG